MVVRPGDWGPHTSTRRVIDLSRQAVHDLGVTTDDHVDIAFAAPGNPLGVGRPLTDLGRSTTGRRRSLVEPGLSPRWRR